MRLPMHLKTILIATAVVAVSFVISLKVMDWVAPRGATSPPVLVELPPLPPAPRSSTIMAPVAVALSAIRDAADRGAQRSFAGKADNPVSQILQNADIGWTASRGLITATGAQDVLSLSTPHIRHAQRHRLAVGEGHRRGRRCARRPARRRCRKTHRRHQHQEPERQRRDQGQRHHHRAAEDRRRVADRAQSHGTGQSRRYQPGRGRRARQRAGAGQAADRQAGRRPDRHRAGEDAQRSRLRKRCANAMGQGLPLGAAAGHRREFDVAGAVARTASDPRDCGPAARRCIGGDADTRHRGGNPYHAGRDQARLPVPRHHHRSCRRRRGGYRSAFPSTCPLPKSTRSSKRSSPERPFRKTAQARSMSR